jgi:putative CocE/NonD family hydrolase
MPFFNFFLKGKGDVGRLPEASIFLSGANEWRSFEQWPPAGKSNQTLYLHPGGKLDWRKPQATGSFSEYLSDPSKPVPYTEDVHFNRTRTYMNDDQRFAERRPDVLSFKTEILTEDLTVTGNVAADLLASISTTDADFVVKLIDVFPDTLSYNAVDIYADKDPELKYPMGGYEMLVHGEIFRGRYRKSYEKPEAFVPGKTEKVNFKLGDVAHTFKTGHRVMIQVQSSWFPLADRNPQKFVNIYNAKESDFQKATIRIFHNASNASSITLPVLSK